MTWEVKEKDNPQGKDDDGRVFVSDGSESFHVDRTGAQRLCDLLNDGAKSVRAPRKDHS